MTPPPATPNPTPAAYISRAGLLEGAIAMTPIVLSQSAFGVVFGTLAAQKGLTLAETLSMSGLVYAGLAQVVSLQSWPETFTVASLATLALATATVNLRFLLMSLTFRPWLGSLPAGQAYPPLLLTTDAGWLKAMGYHAGGGNDVGYFLGGGLFLYVTWLIAAVPGYLFSSWLTNPKALGIDMLIPAFFAALLIPAWKGARRAIPWVISGLIAVSVQWLIQGYWYIIAGAFAGAISAGLMSDDE
jgi:predicted branched-subunit amino acid permease